MRVFFAMDARVILISDLRKNDLVEHPKGGYSFGEVPDIPQHGIRTGQIYLRKGQHFANGAGFGVEHIWIAHEYDLKKLGYLIPEDIAAYVAHIVQVGTPIFCDLKSQPAKDGRRVQVLRSRYGLLILEPIHVRQRDGLGYYVVTAFPKRQTQGTKIGEIQKAP